jgi:hypothetical protein
MRTTTVVEDAGCGDALREASARPAAGRLALSTSKGTRPALPQQAPVFPQVRRPAPRLAGQAVAGAGLRAPCCHHLAGRPGPSRLASPRPYLPPAAGRACPHVDGGCRGCERARLHPYHLSILSLLAKPSQLPYNAPVWQCSRLKMLHRVGRRLLCPRSSSHRRQYPRQVKS